MEWQTGLYLLERAWALGNRPPSPTAPDSTRMNTTEVFNGVRYPGYIHSLESLKAACSFQFQDTDVLLVTFPKSGERDWDKEPGEPNTQGFLPSTVPRSPFWHYRVDTCALSLSPVNLA